MEMPSVPEIAGAIVSDVAAAFGLPGASSAGLVISGYLQRRARAAREILLDELKSAGITNTEAASSDRAIGFIYRYKRAAIEGAARLNLRLLAKALASTLQIRSLSADDFLAQVDVIASLSRNEIIVIAELYRAWQEQQSERAKNPHITFVEDPWAITQRTLGKKGMAADEIRTAATMAQRTGLIYTGETLDDMASFLVSPNLITLAKSVDFQDALHREAKNSGEA